MVEMVVVCGGLGWLKWMMEVVRVVRVDDGGC